MHNSPAFVMRAHNRRAFVMRALTSDFQLPASRPLYLFPVKIPFGYCFLAVFVKSYHKQSLYLRDSQK